ncbi:MAG: rhodanese-like domain-containing protein [Actinomycetota bacterium]|nr:rhodanese-like domain-containing protein [Actinomycetota bacterium]
MTTTATATTATTARDAAVEHFAAKLRYETDPSDVAAAQTAGDRFVLVDTRGHVAWQQGRAAGAIHLPTGEISARAASEIPLDAPVVVYCWGPGCNGSTKAALHFSRLGYEVRELIGGFEYWAREGLPVVDDAGPVLRPVDELTGPRVSSSTSSDGVIGCDC